MLVEPNGKLLFGSPLCGFAPAAETSQQPHTAGATALNLQLVLTVSCSSGGSPLVLPPTKDDTQCVSLVILPFAIFPVQ